MSVSVYKYFQLLGSILEPWFFPYVDSPNLYLPWNLSTIIEQRYDPSLIWKIVNSYTRLFHLFLETVISWYSNNITNDFKRSVCYALGKVHEIGSFLVHGEAIVQVFMGDLDNLNLFGPQDTYIKPVLRALVPVIQNLLVTLHYHINITSTW